MKTRAEIAAMDDTIKECLATAESPNGTYYFIQTTFASFPKFVVGELRESDGSVRLLFRCGMHHNAINFWSNLVDNSDKDCFFRKRIGLCT